MPTVINSRRRWFGVFFLLLAGGMLVWGQTWLRRHLTGGTYLVYWLVCMVWVMLALVTALVDARATRRQLRQEQRALWDRTLGGIDLGNDRASGRRHARVRRGEAEGQTKGNPGSEGSGSEDG